YIPSNVPEAPQSHRNPISYWKEDLRYPPSRSKTVIKRPLQAVEVDSPQTKKWIPSDSRVSTSFWPLIPMTQS
ncbi:hypothetical protein JTE90_000579, partial [Oedothorax gibbosus]